MMDFKLLAHECNEPLYQAGVMSTTMAYYPPRYDENGVNQNPDRNVTSGTVTCTKCGRSWHISMQYGEETKVEPA